MVCNLCKVTELIGWYSQYLYRQSDSPALDLILFTLCCNYISSVLHVCFVFFLLIDKTFVKQTTGREMCIYTSIIAQWLCSVASCLWSIITVSRVVRSLSSSEPSAVLLDSASPFWVFCSALFPSLLISLIAVFGQWRLFFLRLHYLRINTLWEKRSFFFSSHESIKQNSYPHLHHSHVNDTSSV